MIGVKKMIDGHYIMIPKEEYLEYEALKEKNTPKKADMTVFNTYCPHCKQALGKEFAMNGLRGRLGTQYCPICGQALDWSEEEND